MSQVTYFSPLYFENPSSVFGRLYNASEALFDFGLRSHYTIDCTNHDAKSMNIMKHPAAGMSFFGTIVKIALICTVVFPLIALLVKATVHQYKFKIINEGLGSLKFDASRVKNKNQLKESLVTALSSVETHRVDTPPRGRSGVSGGQILQVEMVREPLFKGVKFMINNGGDTLQPGIFGIRQSAIDVVSEFTGENAEIQKRIGAMALLLMIYLDSKEMYGDECDFDFETFTQYITTNIPNFADIKEVQWKRVMTCLTARGIIQNSDQKMGLKDHATTLKYFKLAANNIKDSLGELEHAVKVHQAKKNHIEKTYTQEHRTKLFESLVTLAKEGGSFAFLEGNFGIHQLSLKAHDEMGWVTEDHTRLFNAIAIKILLYLDIHSDPIGTIKGAKLSAYEQVSEFNLAEFRNYLCRFAKIFEGFSETQMYQLFNFIGPILKAKGYLNFVGEAETENCYMVQLAEFDKVVEFFQEVTKKIEDELLVVQAKKLEVGSGVKVPFMLQLGMKSQGNHKALGYVQV